jgi:integrase
LAADKIMGMAPAAGERLWTIRNRALLLLGFAGAFHRSELVALNIEDIEETKDEPKMAIRRGKTDQEGQGAHSIVKAHAARVGLDPVNFSGHSFRSGSLTSAAARGASIFKMADQSRHKSMYTLRGNVRDAEIFKDHAGAGLL